MIRRIILTILAVSLVEIVILVRLGVAIGIWPMFAIVFGVGAIGILLARSQGLRTLHAIQRDLMMGRMPAPRLVDQALIVIGAILLIVPGLLTDLVGLALVLPPTRALAKRMIGTRIGRRLERRGQDPAMAGNDITDEVSYTVIIP